MHDLDRIQLEGGERDYDDDREFEEEEEAYELSGDTDSDDLELAAELLEVTSEEELEEFLGTLVKKAGRLAGRALRSDTGRALVGVLKDAARDAIPAAGAALGRSAGRKVTDWLGLELEGLSPEDQEFERARAFVRFAREAARQAARAPASRRPSQVARRACTRAARRQAPALLPAVTGRSPSADGSRQSGRWVRQGDTIVVHNI